MLLLFKYENNQRKQKRKISFKKTKIEFGKRKERIEIKIKLIVLLFTSKFYKLRSVIQIHMAYNEPEISWGINLSLRVNADK